MSTIVEEIQGLKNLLPLKGATDAKITDAELRLGVAFAEDYKEYLSTFGAIIADGIELTGIANSPHRDVVAVTKQEWALNSSVPHKMYVIENTGIDGIIFWQNGDGKIYRTSPNQQPKKIAESLSEYVAQKSV